MKTMNDYCLYLGNASSLAEELMDICDDYAAKILSNEEFEKIIMYYHDIYPDILYDEGKYIIKKSIYKITGLKRLTRVIGVLKTHGIVKT